MHKFFRKWTNKVFDIRNIKLSNYKILLMSLILIAFIIIIFFSGCHRSSRENLKKLKVAEATRSVFYVPQYVADSLGYFKNHGLEIEFVTSEGSDKTMTAVLSRGAEIGLAGAEMALYVKNGGKENYPIIFAQLTQKDGSYILGRKQDINVKNGDIADVKSLLNGKSIIAGRPGGMPFMSLEFMLRNLDIYNKVRLLTNVKFEIMAPSFISGVGDFVTLFEPAATKLVESGNAVIVGSVGELVGEVCYTCYFANPGFMKNNESTIQNFVEAIYEGQIWVKNHEPEEIAKLIVSYFPDSCEEILIKSLKNYKKLNVWAENPIIKKSDFDKVLKIIGYSGDMQFEEFVDNTYSEKCLKNFEVGSVVDEKKSAK